MLTNIMPLKTTALPQHGEVPVAFHRYNELKTLQFYSSR